MTDASAVPRHSHGWQLILADLALILFLLALSSLPAVEAGAGRAPVEARARAEDVQRSPVFEIASAQALFRPVAGGPSLGEWLASQPRDPRATLTVFVRHRPGGEGEAWRSARLLVREAEASGVAVRTVIAEAGEKDLYASLAYDAPAR
jgi:hypothetical protein